MKKFYTYLKTIPLFLFCLTYISCNSLYKTDIKTKGLAPIYVKQSTLNDIENLAVQPFKNTGRVTIWNQYIFLNEYNKGIHVIDNTNQNAPQKITFISIPFNKDFSIKGTKLYADNGKDLVVLDINDVRNITLITRMTDVFSKGYDMYPPSYIGYYECVDTSQGWVYDWEEKTLTNPECKTF